MTKFTCMDGEQRVVGTWYPYPFTKAYPRGDIATIPVRVDSGYDCHLWVTDGRSVCRWSVYGTDIKSHSRTHWCVSYSTPEVPPLRVSTEEMGKPIMDQLDQLGDAVERAKVMLRYGSPLFYMSAEERRRRMRGYDLIIGNYGISFLDK